jgi:hypothetical protein
MKRKEVKRSQIPFSFFRFQKRNASQTDLLLLRFFRFKAKIFFAKPAHPTLYRLLSTHRLSFAAKSSTLHHGSSSRVNKCKQSNSSIYSALHGRLAFRNKVVTVIHSTAKTQYRKFEQIFPEKELHGQSPNFHIYVSVSDLYIPAIDLPILLQEIHMWTDPANIYNVYYIPMYIIHRSQTHECGDWD